MEWVSTRLHKYTFSFINSTPNTPFYLSASNKTMQYTSSLTRPPNTLHLSTMQHFTLTLLNYRPIVPWLVLTLHSERVLNTVLLKTMNYQHKMAVGWQQNVYSGVLPGIAGTIAITFYTAGCFKLALQPITTIVRCWVGFWPIHKLISYWKFYY